MGKRATKAKTGRKPLPIDPKVVEGMASVGATNEEIADFNGCSVDTITRRFADILSKSRASMKIRLRRLQWTAASEGDRTMLIWLGKQVLGQSDESRIRVGNLDQLSDEELAAIAAGKVPK
jgi:hypothetical protein